MSPNKNLMPVQILSLLAVMFLCSVHPPVHAADTLKITITYSYRVGTGPGQAGRMVISQKFHTVEDTLFREIRYDGETGQISGYTFYFYKEGKPYSEETYGPDDKLMFLLRYDYDDSGNLIRTLLTGHVPDVGNPVRETRYRYNSSGQRDRTKILREGKSAATLKYIHEPGAGLIQFVGKYKASYDTSVRKETRSYSYDPDGRLRQIHVRGKDAGGQRYDRTHTYSYDEAEGKETITTVDGLGALLSRKVITCLSSGLPGTYEETDGTGAVVKRLEYAYRTNFMEKGLQKSVLDPAIGF